MGHWNDDLDLIRQAAQEAANIAHAYFGRSPQVWWKNNGSSPVSAADFAANERLQNVLLKARPDYGWLSEETDDDPARLERDTLFVVDPIDGTRAFINGESTWCVSVAVVHQGAPVAAVLAAPALGEEFFAAADGEAVLNGKAIEVRAERPSGDLTLAADERVVNALSEPLGGRVERVRHVPSLAYRLAMVADARLDGTVVKPDSHDWDLAAADLILERAGGRLVDLDGNRLVYNRATVSHGALVAGTEPALEKLLPSLARLSAG